MARGKKNYTLEEKLEMINAQLEAAKESVAELEKQKEQIESEIETNQLRMLSEKLKEKGLSIEEVFASISSEEN